MDRKEALEKVRKLAELANPESNAFESEIANAHRAEVHRWQKQAAARLGRLSEDRVC